MRVLLIVPTHRYKYVYPSFLSNTDFPTGIAYLASALSSAGHEIFGLNLNNDTKYRSSYEMVYNRISQSLRESQPELIGLGGLCTDFKFLKDAIQIIRKLAPDIPIVCGGGIINNDATFVFHALRPDFCIIGEGEEILVQLANMLESGKQDYEQIDNLGYWDNGTARCTKQNFNYIDINKRCFPDYEPFGIKEMLDDYSMATRYACRYTRPNPRPMPIVTARGCPFNCTFCVHQKGSRYRARSIENIIQEIAFLFERYHFNILIILDELFALNKLKMKEFCVAILGAREAWGWDFNWAFQTHASASFDREVLEIAKESGCYYFSYGLESASPRVLESMNKKTKPSQIIQAIEIANSVGIGFGGNFIFGDVSETQETVHETMDFFSRYCFNIHIFLGFVQPYPGSKLFENIMERGIIRNKLEFYEQIQERIWNMTSMPDKLWLPWIHLMFFLASSFPWAKSTNALRCIEELETADNPMAYHSGKLMYKIWAKCPYCSKDVYYRELLAAKSKKAASFLLVFRQVILRINAVSRNKLTRILLRLGIKNAVLYFLSFRHPLFKLLKIIISNKTNAATFFVTGCPSCNKRIKIYISSNDSKGRIDLVIKKFFFKCIWLSLR